MKPRPRLCRCLLWLTLLFCDGAWAQDLTPIARQPLDALQVSLGAEERTWLAQKNALVVGVLHDPLPPLRMFDERQGFEGLMADYLVALQRELGVPIRVRAFPTRDGMYDALRAGSIDLASNVTPPMAKSRGLQLTPPYALTDLALFAEAGDLREYDIGDAKTRIAVANQVMLDIYRNAGGRGVIRRYPSALVAMAAVLTGDADVFLGDTLSTHYLSSQLFSNQLVISQSTHLPELQVGFALEPGNRVLAGILQRALGGIARCQIVAAQYLWGDTEDCEFSDFRKRLSEPERAWLAHAGSVRLAISEDLAPYAFFDSRGRFNGIASDVLDIIRRKTGLRLRITRVSSLSEADALLAHGEASLGILPQVGPHQPPYLHTQPIATAPYLQVMRQDAAGPGTLDAGSRATVAIARGYLQPELLAGRYPQLAFKQTQTMGEAFKLVRDGAADMVLAPANVARYYLSYKYGSDLKIGGIFDGPGAQIVFAAPGDQPQLVSILDKAMLEITPRQYLQIVGRWRANSATDDKYWEGVASYIQRSFEALGVLLAVAGLLILFQRQRIRRKRRDLEQRQLLLDELRAAKESAEKASRAKSVFLATMSHEIRTPLNAIIGMLELVLTRRDDAELNAQSVHIAYESAIGLLALIGDILDISRIESGKLTLVPEPARLRDLLESVGNVFSALARQKQLRLSLDIAPLAAELVWVDGLKVKQILSNLLSNAIKFTERGGVDIRCRAEPAGPSALRLVVSVSDSGAGIPPAQLGQVFQPFFVVDGAVNDPNAGAGLGLAISQALCRLMGGSLEASSEVGVGTRMTFSVELERVIGEGPAPGAAGAEPAAETGEPLTVLIVEDHLPSQYLLYQQVSYLGHRALTASNGLEGLALWQEQEVDIVITDCNMPELDGHQMTQTIRRLERAQGIRPCLIIGLTADAQREELERCRASGMDHALAKPINLAGLNRLVPKFGADAPPASGSPSLTNDIRAAMAEQILRSNAEEHAALGQALAAGDLPGVRRRARKLKGSAYLLNHQRLLEQCVEVEELCSGKAPSAALREAVARLLQTLDEIDRSLRAS